MFRVLIPIVLIYISQGAYAFDNSMDVNSDSAARDFTAISELFPDPEALQCQSTCSGEEACGQFTDIDSCIDQGAPLGCFWSCQ